MRRLRRSGQTTISVMPPDRDRFAHNSGRAEDDLRPSFSSRHQKRARLLLFSNFEGLSIAKCPFRKSYGIEGKII